MSASIISLGRCISTLRSVSTPECIFTNVGAARIFSRSLSQVMTRGFFSHSMVMNFTEGKRFCAFEEVWSGDLAVVASFNPDHQERVTAPCEYFS